MIFVTENSPRVVKAHFLLRLIKEGCNNLICRSERDNMECFLCPICQGKFERKIARDKFREML
jgi:hypothetical protein